jgi:thiamine-phosphate pyrophosphorylase
VTDARRDRLRSARLYLVCDARSDEFLESALRGGVDVVQLRMKDAGGEDVLAVAARYKPACAAHGALFIVNDRPELAVSAGADGVHLGQDDMTVDAARQILGGERLIGLSTHSPAEVDAAAEAKVDYIGVGPVHETPTKPGRPAVGLALVEYAAAHAAVPFFAIGGISSANVEEVVAAGATRTAVVRALTEAGDPEAAAGALRAALCGKAQETSVGAA